MARRQGLCAPTPGLCGGRRGRRASGLRSAVSRAGGLRSALKLRSPESCGLLPLLGALQSARRAVRRRPRESAARRLARGDLRRRPGNPCPPYVRALILLLGRSPHHCLLREFLRLHQGCGALLEKASWADQATRQRLRFPANTLADALRDRRRRQDRWHERRKERNDGGPQNPTITTIVAGAQISL